MICIPHNPVLLVTPPGMHSTVKAAKNAEAWLEVRGENIRDVMREVLIHKPGAVVIDLCMSRTGTGGFDFAVRVIAAVRRRLPKIVIVVLGAEDDSLMETVVRRHGITAYLPTNSNESHQTVSRFIGVIDARDGPARAHGPPASGVPPR